MEPVRMPGVAGNENEFVSLGPGLAPFEIVLDLGWLIVLVNAEKARVEIVPRKCEIIGVAAEKRDLLLRREDKPDVRIAFVTIEMVHAALVERDHIAAQPGL